MLHHEARIATILSFYCFKADVTISNGNNITLVVLQSRFCWLTLKFKKQFTSVDCINLVRDKEEKWALEKTVMNMGVQSKTWLLLKATCTSL